MILEVAVLDVKPGNEAAFERDFETASAFISGVDGYVSHELQRCVEKKNRYILLVRWKTIEAHTEGFRKSPQYAEWKKLLHHYYDPFPAVEHYSAVVARRWNPTSGRVGSGGDSSNPPGGRVSPAARVATRRRA